MSRIVIQEMAARDVLIVLAVPGLISIDQDRINNLGYSSRLRIMMQHHVGVPFIWNMPEVLIEVYGEGGGSMKERR